MGMINYQGDLKPNSFTFQHSNFTAALIVRKPLNPWVTLRSGLLIGKVEGADRYNRGYLQPRNLSFFTYLKEAHAGFELSLLNFSATRFTPYFYGGIGVFHFNPYTYDRYNQKVFLNPLNTEGQGLPEYPEQKSYGLTQWVMPFGGGIRFALTKKITASVEFSQRKTFFDYLDDVSTHYVDQEILLMAKGPKAVELAFRSNELPGQPGYPAHGEQRGTPSEMDWYYFFGVTLEAHFNTLTDLFKSTNPSKRSYQQRCPRKISL